MIPSFESEHLFYRPVSLQHLSTRYVDWLNDPIVIKYLESGGNYTIELLKDFLGAIELKDLYFWAIHLKSNDKHIGNIKIDPINGRHGTGEYGIMMGDRSEWGKGYAKEATQRILEYCFKELGIRKITLGVVAENVVALKLYEKLGFEKEGFYRMHVNYHGKLYDVIRMAKFNPKNSNGV
jgi:ribosomal-protein-alanine N-acetyltransferase